MKRITQGLHYGGAGGQGCGMQGPCCCSAAAGRNRAARVCAAAAIASRLHARVPCSHRPQTPPTRRRWSRRSRTARTRGPTTGTRLRSTGRRARSAVSAGRWSRAWTPLLLAVGLTWLSSNILTPPHLPGAASLCPRPVSIDGRTTKTFLPREKDPETGWYTDAANAAGPNSPFDRPFYIILRVPCFFSPEALSRLPACRRRQPLCMHMAVLCPRPPTTSREFLLACSAACCRHRLGH